MIWGTGRPRREFLYSDDAADACIFLMDLEDEEFDRLTNAALEEPPLINIGCGEDLTILELAEVVRRVVGYTGRFRCDPSKPDGTPRKLLSVERLRRFGWSPRIKLEDGIGLAYRDYLSRLTDAREARR